MENMLFYKEKPLVRRGNMIYYGNPEDKYMIILIVNGTKKVKDLEVATSVTIQLMRNDGQKGKMMKQAERDGMYAAMDIAEYWLNDALENG